jgi:hypothetical protein
MRGEIERYCGSVDNPGSRHVLLVNMFAIHRLTYNNCNRLGSLQAGACNIEHQFNIITGGRSAAFLHKMRTELSQLPPDGDNSVWVNHLENVTCEVCTLLRSMEEYSNGILQEAGCGYEWQEIDKTTSEIRNVLRGLEEIVCDVM